LRIAFLVAPATTPVIAVGKVTIKARQVEPRSRGEPSYKRPTAALEILPGLRVNYKARQFENLKVPSNTLYAIIEDGRRQFQVEEGQQVEVDYRDLPAGTELTFDRVLAYRDDDGLKIGQPALEAASVTAKVVSAVQGPKLVIQKFRRRKNERRRTGHRQLFTKVLIEKIKLG
jgi:large subunit ribosomal protein L21